MQKNKELVNMVKRKEATIQQLLKESKEEEAGRPTPSAESDDHMKDRVIARLRQENAELKKKLAKKDRAVRKLVTALNALQGLQDVSDDDDEVDDTDAATPEPSFRPPTRSGVIASPSDPPRAPAPSPASPKERASEISILPPPEAADFDAMMRRGENEVEELNGFISQLAERFDGLEGELKQKTALLAELQREEESAKAEHAMLLRQLQSHEARMIHEEGPVPRKEPEPRMAVPQGKAPAPSREPPAPAPQAEAGLDEAEDDLMQMQDRVNQLQSMLQMLGGLAGEEEEEPEDTRRVPVPRPGGRPASPPSAAAAPGPDRAAAEDSMASSLAGLGALLGELKGLSGGGPLPAGLGGPPPTGPPAGPMGPMGPMGAQGLAPPRGKGMQAAPKRSAAPPQPSPASSAPADADPSNLFNTLGELEEKKRQIEQLAAMLNIKLD